MSSNPVFKDFEGQIILCCDHRRGLWGAQVRLRGRRNFRIAGTLPTVASAHTLLTVGLMSALRSITRNQAAEVVASTPERITRPRLLIVCADKTFGTALTAKIRRQDGPILRSGRQFLIELARQIARFTVTLETSVDNEEVNILRSWMNSQIHDPKVINGLSQSLLPTVISA